jgi:sugar O-acyltransferase (sialic acid O-acetyltransferase NeuD family)
MKQLCIGSPKPLVIVGAGGFGITEVVWVAEEMNTAAKRAGTDTVPWQIVGYADDDPSKRGVKHGAYVVHGTIEQTAAEFNGQTFSFVISVGDNEEREKLAHRAESVGWLPATLVHPSSVVAEGALIGPGSYIAPGCVVCPSARVGRHVLINMQALVAHNSYLADYVQVCPGVKVNGGCRVGKYALLGSNATLMPGTEVGCRGVVGPNSCVVQTVAPGETVMGCPARVVWRKGQREQSGGQLITDQRRLNAVESAGE